MYLGRYVRPPAGAKDVLGWARHLSSELGPLGRIEPRAPAHVDIPSDIVYSRGIRD